MLWLCLHFPLLPAEALGLHEPLDVVTAQRGASRWLIHAAPGLAAGMALGTALSIQPQLRAHPRRAKAEQAMLLALAHGLYRHGSPVHIQMRELEEVGRAPLPLLWLEIGASLQLFGGWPALRTRISAELAEQQHAMQLAVAPSRAAAALLAATGNECFIDRVDALDAALAALAITTLPWPVTLIEALHGVGLRTLGALFSVPRAAFARRYGTPWLHELDQLRGHASEPARAIVPPQRFRRRFELAGEIESIEALLFPLRRLVLELQAWLRARDVGVLAIGLRCDHPQRRRTQFQLRFQDAHRDAQRMLDALRERLQREPLPAPVRSLELASVEIAEAAVASSDLFDDAARSNDWSAAIERIAARLGDQALWTPQHHADHRPHRTQTTAATADAGAEDLPPRPLWLLRQPLLLPGLPRLDTQSENIGERIESGWWDGDDVRRDYHVVEWQQTRAWVFRSWGRDGSDERWYLHGLWG